MGRCQESDSRNSTGSRGALRDRNDTKTMFMPAGVIEPGSPNEMLAPPAPPKAPSPKSSDTGKGRLGIGDKMGGVLGGSSNLWRHTGQLACFCNHLEIHALWKPWLHGRWQEIEDATEDWPEATS